MAVSVWKVTLLVAISAITLASCTGHPDTPTDNCFANSGQSVGAAATVRVVPDPNTVGAFEPKSVRVMVGQAVEWDWADGSSSHTVTADDGSFDSGLCGLGAKFVYTFAKAGTFPYKCTIHPAMIGTVTVT